MEKGMTNIKTIRNIGIIRQLISNRFRLDKHSPFPVFTFLSFLNTSLRNIYNDGKICLRC